MSVVANVMGLTQEESEIVNRYALHITQTLGKFCPSPYANVLVCDSFSVNDGRDPDIIRRLLGPDFELEPDVSGQGGSTIAWVFKVYGAALEVAFDYNSIRERSKSKDYLTTGLANFSDAFILVYDDSNRESFESIIRFNDFISSLPVESNPQPSKGTRGKLLSNTSCIQPRSLWQRLIGGRAQKPSKRHSVSATSDSDLPTANEEDMDPGPIPKMIVCNHNPKGPNMVSQEEGEELARRLRVPFYTTSISITGYGDRDILEKLIPRLIYRRACGEGKGRPVLGLLRPSFATWSQFGPETVGE